MWADTTKEQLAVQIISEHVFDNATEAKCLLDRLGDIIIERGYALISDFYDSDYATVPGLSFLRIGIDHCSFGWDDISSAEVICFGERVYINMPEPINLADRIHVSPTTRKEQVNHPAHYQTKTGLEVIDIIEAVTFDLKGVEAFDIGNALKYICRYTKKNGVQDLEKAAWYLDHVINHIKNLEKENT